MQRNFLAFALLALVLSCSREAQPQAVETLDVVSPETKMTLSSNKLLWNSGDAVSVFYCGSANERWLYSGKDGSRTGVLIHPVSSGRVRTSSDVYAVFPYDAEASMDGTVLHTKMPSGCREEIRPLLAASCTDMGTLSFTCLSAVMKFSLSGTAAVQSIVLSGEDGENIAGSCEVDFSGSVPALSAAGGTAVSAVGPFEVDGGADFYFSIAPVSFAEGYRYTVTYADSSVETFRVCGALDALAGKVYCSSAATGYDPDTISTTVAFTDGSKRYFPTTDGPFSFTAGILNGPYSYGGYEYSLYFPEGAISDSRRVTVGGGLRISNGGYVLLPQISGFALSRISLYATYAVSMDVSADDAPTVILDGTDVTIPKSSYGTVKITGAVEGKYRLNIHSGCGISVLRLYYSRVL